MNGFLYNTPTKVYFGAGAEERLPEILKGCGHTRALLVYGGGSAERSGLLTRIKWGLDEAGIKYAALGGVQANPRLFLVNEGISLCRAENTQIIIAVGGGSVIDTAKAIGIGALYGGDVWDFYAKKISPKETLPVAVVLTNAAAGSEMSNSSVITNEEICEKRGINTDVIRPAFAFLNPQLTLSVPEYVTACGCADIFMHTAERYLSSGGTLKITDSLSEALMTSVITSSKAVMRNLQDLSARADLMWASSLSHNGLTGCGTDGGDWAVHALGHEISALYDTAHGAALTAVWGSWARYVYKNDLNRFHRFAVQVMGVRPSGTREELALKGIEATEEWFSSLKLPTNLKELNITPTDEILRLMAKKCAKGCGGVKGSVRKLNEEDMYNIYKAASEK